MDITEEIVTQEQYKKFFQRLRSETLRQVIKDRSTALESARKGVIEIDPEKLNDDNYIQLVADLMQKLAKLLLVNRVKHTNSDV